MTAVWDRGEALRVAERLERPHWGMAGEAALLRAAAAEIARLRAREADAERMAEALRADAERLRAVLRFYASENGWDEYDPAGCDQSVMLDGGDRARAALAQEPGE